MKILVSFDSEFSDYELGNLKEDSFFCQTNTKIGCISNLC